MLLVVEGMDGGGKSTFAREIALQHVQAEDTPSLRILHKGLPPPGLCPYVEYELGLEELADEIYSPDHLLIMDRWHAGEIVYGPIYRGKSRLSLEGMHHVEMALSAAGAVKFICQPFSLTTVRQRLRERGDWFLKQEHEEEVHAAYETLALRYKWQRVKPETRPRTAYSAAIEEARRLTAKAAELRKASRGTYLGNLFPAVLLFGDARGMVRPDLILPFTPLRENDGSSLLMAALHEAKLINKAGIVNTSDTDPALVPDLKAVWEATEQPLAIALGNYASGRLEDAGIPHAKIPHPSWWARFRTADRRRTYARSIEEATWSSTSSQGAKPT